MIEVLFEVEKDTKRTRRFSETACKIKGEDEAGPVSGTLYIQQWALKAAFGDDLPESVKVTVELAATG